MSFFGRRADTPAASAPPPPPPPSPFPSSDGSPTASAFSAPSPPSRSAAVQLATAELEGMTNLFNRLADSCFDKCVVKLSSADMAVGELACDDRCAIKYMEAQTIIADVIKKTNQQQMTQMQAQQQ